MMFRSQAPVSIGALAMRARQRIRAHFFAQHAVTAEEAVSFVPQDRIERTQFERMRGAGLVHEAEAGRYWFDLPAFRKQLDRTRAIMVPVVIVLCLAIAGVGMLFY